MPVASFTLSTLSFCSAISLCAARRGGGRNSRSFRARDVGIDNAFSNAFGQQPAGASCLACLAVSGGIRCCWERMSTVRSDTQPVDGIASCHRAANCAESDRADRSAVPAAAARADCTTARVRLRPRRLVLASTASEAFAGAERDPDRGEGLL
jgi:hypothetical protein